MIRPHRLRHRWIVVVLALILPLLFALGLAARREAPRAPLPPQLATDQPIKRPASAPAVPRP